MKCLKCDKENCLGRKLLERFVARNEARLSAPISSIHQNSLDYDFAEVLLVTPLFGGGWAKS